MYLEEKVESKEATTGVEWKHGRIIHLDPIRCFPATFLKKMRERRKKELLYSHSNINTDN